ncbi:hypothetical protein JCM16138_01590 [Thermococcus atlanticus]
MNLISIAGNYTSAIRMWKDIKEGISLITRKPLSMEEQLIQFEERLPQLLSFFSWGIIGFFSSDETKLKNELGPSIILLGTSDRNILLKEACSYFREIVEYSRAKNVNIDNILRKYPDIHRSFRIANIICDIYSEITQDNSISKENIVELCNLVPSREILLTLKEYFESQGYEVPKELIETLGKFPKPKEINYWEEYQKTLKEFEENGRKFHEKAKKEWELVEGGNTEDPIGSIQEVIWNLSGGVVYNFALRRFKLVREAYEIFLKAYEFAKENNLFKTKLSEDIWLGKLKRVNLKWGNDIKWYEDYRVISNRIIRLTRITEFMMWKRRIPEFLYANPYINLGGDYEHNDPPLWALTRGLMIILNHNHSRGVPPGVELQEEVLSHALRLNLLWPEKTEIWECRDGICAVFRGRLNERALRELNRNIWDDDVVFYNGKNIVVGYSRKRKLGYVCAKSKDEKDIMALVS